MSTTTEVPEPEGEYPQESASVPRWVAVVFVVVFVLLGYLLYAGHTSRKALEAEVTKANQRADLLAAQLEQVNTRVADLRGQLEVASDRLQLTQEELGRARALAQTIRKEQKATDERLLAQLGEVREESEVRIGKVAGEVSGAKADIEATRRDLEATKSKLERTIGDLGVQSGLIARNHEELEMLKRLGERDIHEFDLRKAKTPQRVGPIQAQLKKVDTKKFRYTLDVLADDKRIEKKDKTLNEPVQFYVRGARMPYEIVVFELSKDRIVGYLSTPKEVAPKQP